MTFKIGLVGLCTSHPTKWVPIIRELAAEGTVDAEVVAVWDSAETRPADFAESFRKEYNIPLAVRRLEDLIDKVDGVIVHTTNWDRHVEQARPFVEAGKSVLIDKPFAGNLKDLSQLLSWEKQGKRVSGGSSLYFCAETRAFREKMATDDKGRLHTAHACVGTDEFNYGIHGYAMLCGLMGPGVRSVRYLGCSLQGQLQINWKNGNIGFLTYGEGSWTPFTVMAIREKGAELITAGPNIYRDLLTSVLPYLTGKTDQPPVPLEAHIEPELAALAARISRAHHGQEIALADLRVDDPGYDGTRFAMEYRRSRGI